MFEAIIPFKFQSDSINTDVSPSSNRALHHFKFQSDSINTCHHFQSRDILATLNSNLILLILIPFTQHITQMLNFKFQSDSINTHPPCLP